MGLRVAKEMMTRVGRSALVTDEFGDEYAVIEHIGGTDEFDLYTGVLAGHTPPLAVKLVRVIKPGMSSSV